MSSSSTDLISMADIARLAGEKRATVGNWKARNPDDFPRERGRGARGPLYDRAEVIDWLEARNRLHVRAPEVEALWSMTNSFRGYLGPDEVMPLLLMLLAIKSAGSDEWHHLGTSAPTDMSKALEGAAHRLFPFADDVLPHRALPPGALHETVAMLATFDTTRAGELTDALFGQAATAMGARGGEFLTPQSVRKLIVALVEPTGVLYNPATGVGQLMTDAATESQSRGVRFIGQEINSRIWAMAQLNLAMHGVDAEIALGDVFGEDRFPDLRADRVMCVPPWNQRLPIAETLGDDPRWVFGEPGPNDGNAAWTQHCLAHLADNGRAVIVLPNGALFEGGRSGRIRQRIVKAGLLDAVFALPGGLFAWTGLPCAVLVFARGRASVDGKPAPTLMVDLTESHEPQARTSTLSNKLINDAAALYREWRRGRAPKSDYAALATFDDLAANEFVVDPGRYLSLPRATQDIADVTRARDELVEQLASLTRETQDADTRLQKILGVRP